MNWQHLYDSGWHHPGVAWVGVSLATLLLLKAKPGAHRTVMLVMTALTATDALFTGAASPLPKDSWLVTPVSIFFVIAGDLRLWLLVERARSSSWLRAAAVAVPLAFVVPVLQGVATRVWPETFVEPRRIYLVYEVLMLVLLVVVLAWRQPVGATRRLVTLFLVQYGLWATCDVLLLSGLEWPLGLRLVPNALYYAVFPVAAAAWLAEPRRATDPATSSLARPA